MLGKLNYDNHDKYSVVNIFLKLSVNDENLRDVSEAMTWERGGPKIIKFWLVCASSTI